MTEELKAKIDKYVKDTCVYYRSTHEDVLPNQFEKYLKSACIHFATEKGIQWHDLRKDPNDLPKAQPLNWVLAVYDNGTLWCRARRENFTDGTFWVNSFHHTIENVVLWAKIEIPQFKE